MMYHIYKDNNRIATTEEKTFVVEGLDPNTEYTIGVSKEVSGKESERSEVKVTTEQSSIVPAFDLKVDDKKTELGKKTIPELKEMLDSKGIEYKSTDRKSDLIDRLAGVSDGV